MFPTELSLSKEELIRVFTDVARLKALYAISQLRGSQGFYDWFPKTVQHILDVPAAAISLFADDRLYFESRVGMEPIGDPLRLDESIGRYTAGSVDPLVASETKLHPKMNGAAAVGVRAYLGMPLILPDGMHIGALSALDDAPRQWDEADIAVMRELANIVAAEFEQRAKVFIDRSHKADLNDLRRRIELGLFNLEPRTPKAAFLAALRSARRQYNF